MSTDLGHTYDPGLVVVSVAIAIWASYVALGLAGNVTRAAGRDRRGWLAGGAFAMGTGIWSMHFIGMLAFRLPVPVGYQVSLVLLSVLVAIGASALAMHVASRNELTRSTLGIAGASMGLAIAGMHYIGMASMHMAASIRYRPAVVALSLLIAVAASVAALSLAFRFRLEETKRGWWHKRVAAGVMGVAIAGMHYTAMAAAIFVPATSNIQPSDVLVTDQLAGGVLGGTLIILGIAQAGSLVARRVRLQALNAEIARQTAEAVGESERYYRALIEQGSDVILVFDEQALVTYQSTSAERVLGYAPGELIGRWGLDLVHPGDRELAEGVLQEILRRPEAAVPARCRFKRRDGTWRTIDATGRNLLSDPAVHGIVVNCRDVTEALAVEDQLRQSQKLEAMGQLTAGIVHDFNNALSVILGNAQLVAEDLPADARDARSGLRDIQGAAQTGANMVKKLLAFGRRAALVVKPTDLGLVMSGLNPMLRRVLPATITLDPPPDGHWTARADAGAVEQIVLNLATNARDAMPEGGTLRIKLSQVAVNDVMATRHEVAAGQYVRLTVRDTGVGMDETTKARVFEPFFTTKPPGKGTGLGMAMIRRLTAQQGGFVDFESAPGEGTTVRVHLPAADARAATSPPTRAAVSRGNETILLVEDQEALRRTGQRILQHLGYHVILAEHGRHAIDLLKHHSASVDLVVSDVDMPELDGRALYREVRALGFDLKFMFASGFSPDDGVDLGHGDQVMFVQKPWTVEEIGRAVRSALDSSPGRAGS